MPCQTIRITGSAESFDNLAASRKSPFSRAANIFSSVCGSRLALSRNHHTVRSPTTATATSAVIRIGHITGPPASKYFTRIFASILSFYTVFLLMTADVQTRSQTAKIWLTQPETVDKKTLSLKLELTRPIIKPFAAGLKAPAVLHHIQRSLIQHRKPRALLHLGGNNFSGRIDDEFDRHHPLIMVPQCYSGILRGGMITAVSHIRVELHRRRRRFGCRWRRRGQVSGRGNRNGSL